MSSNLPLDHIRILDLTRMLPGPYCTMILADLGAEVIRVEDPSFPYANPPPFFQKGRHRVSAFNSIIMRNKKSMHLNLKKKEAKEIFYKLVKTSDVIIETYRPKIVDKLEIDYNTVSELNPSIIFCSLTGYGQNGPYEQIAGHDLNYIGICGMLNLNRDRTMEGTNGAVNRPIVPGIQAADVGGALIATISILSAIIERDKNPERRGQYLDIAMMESVFSFIPMEAAVNFSKNLNDGIITENILQGNVPYYSTYRTKDDRFVSVGAIEVKFWRELCKGLNREDLVLKQMAQGSEREYVFSELQNEFLKKTQEEWFQIFKDLDACVMPVKTFEEALEDSQVKAREMVTYLDHPKLGKIPNIASPIKMSRTKLSIRSLAPKPGQHTKDILSKLNYSEDQIRNFKKLGVI